MYDERYHHDSTVPELYCYGKTNPVVRVQNTSCNILVIRILAVSLTYLVQSNLHISTNVGIGILVHRQTCTSVLNEKIGQTDLNLWQLILDGLGNVACDQVTASAGSGYGNLLLIPLRHARGHTCVVGRCR